MYRHCTTRNFGFVRNGFVEKQGIISSGHIRFKATAPPRPPRADLQSIPQAIRELLPEPRKRDPNAPPKRGRSLLFYIALTSPLFIWIALEHHFDPKPLLEKKRARILRERLHQLQEGGRLAVPSSDPKSLVAYVRLLLTTMLPEQQLRNLRSEEVLVLLEEEFPEPLLAWLQQVCPVIHQLSLHSEGEKVETSSAESIQDSADEILRMAFRSVRHRLPPRFAGSE
ncbi:hypothetical protein B0H17DRAFT_1079202 [Mycena rosella]|uniref:Uncharacterized protein n=1 Tax=Mycena rosella TaxID=1033263 RepID=A0AAD7D7F9_MYCRO|nr:hypothetical protein B0H17DRAFT_1079202 [Mycena rosella]